MKELKSIISGMSEKEKKAARRYFAQKYAKTKELRLFGLLDQYSEVEQSKLEAEIRNMGYESSECRSFQKLKVRLRHKLFDFLTTNTSLEGSKEVDENSFLQQRLKKLNLQAAVLLEKSYVNQSKEILHNTLRLAEENGQYASAVETMNELKKIHEIRADYAKKEKVEFRIKHMKFMAERLSELTDTFNDVQLRLETDFLDFAMDKLREAFLLMEAHGNENKDDQISFMSDHLQAMLFQSEGQYSKALESLEKWSGFLNDHPARIPLEHKMIHHQILMENSALADHEDQIQIKDNDLFQENIPLHLKVPALSFSLRSKLMRGDLDKCTEQLDHLEKNVIQPGRMNCAILYHRVFLEFKKGEYRTCLDIINQHLRKFSVTSYQQVDLMILEIMCIFELGKLDLLEYRIQGFSKNLAYRKKFDLPDHYKTCGTLFNNLLRTNYEFSDHKVMEQWSALRGSQINGLLLNSSYQPAFLLDWVLQHAGPGLPSSGEISMDDIAAAIF